MKSEITSYDNLIKQSQDEVEGLRNQYRELRAEAELTRQKHESDIACLQIKLEGKELQLLREREAAVSVERAQDKNQHLQVHIEELLNATKEHLLSRFGEIAARQKLDSYKKGEMSELKVMLAEIHSRKYITPYDLKALEATLDGLWGT